MKPVFLEGQNIFLSPLSKEDNLHDYSMWLNDQETTLYIESGKFPQTINELLEYIDSYNKDKSGILLGIFSKQTSKHIGNITLHKIDWRNRSGGIGIVIGDKESRGKGFSVEAIKLVTEHAFNKLNLRKLNAGIIEGNEASKRAFEKVGFKLEGVLKKDFYLNGKYLDCYRMGLLKDMYI